MGQLSLTFFGSFRVALDENRPIQFNTRSARSLLVYLALHPGRPFQREHLAALLWPEASKEQAQTSLRQSLYRIRQSLTQVGVTDEVLLADAATITFNAASNYRLDVREFNSLFDQCRDHSHSRLDACGDCMQRMRAATELYATGFLTDFSSSDAPGFEDWRALTQERLHNRAIAALETLAAYHQRQRNYRAAAGFLQHILALEPWREETHLALMRTHLLDGKRHLALQQYETLARTLTSELDVQPSAESQAFYAQLRAGLVQPRNSQTPAISPYCGLNAFGQEQASAFFGREETVERLLAEVERRSLLLLVGVSGSGKSSLLHAGLLPALLNQADGASERRVITLHPGDDAFAALAEALRPLLPPVHSLSLADDLRTGATSLPRLLKEAFCAETSKPVSLVILIDQFEELFLSQQEDTVGQHFLKLLAEAPSESFAPHGVALVIALRADFLGQALTYGAFANVIQDRIFALGAMSRAEMARAVELPAQTQNVYFEPGLVERLLDDVGDEAGRLPLLQFCLSRLWQEQADGWISNAAYLEIEGLSGALNHYADGVLARLHPDQQILARRVLLRLVHVQEDVEPSRRLGLRSEFSDAEWAVVQVLTNARLLVSDRTSSGAEYVELVHETLIRNWARLGEWLHADRAFYFWREGLRAGLRLWEKSGRDSGALLRGGLLAEAEIRIADHRGEFSPAEADFIADSLALRSQESEGRRRQQEDERERAAALAVALESRTQALRAAQRATALAQSHGLVSAAQLALFQRETDSALRLAQAALDKEVAPGAELMLADAAYAPGAIRRLLGHSSPVHSVAFYPDGRRAVSASANGNLILSNLESGAQVTRLAGNAGAVYAVQISPDGRRLLSASADGSLILWDGESGEELRRWQGHTGPVRALCFHPDGRCALSAGADKQVILWEVETGRALAHFAGHQQPVYSVAVSPDGTRAVSGDAQGTVIHWELACGREVHRFAGYLERGRESNPLESHYDVIWGIAFRPDGQAALSVSEDQTAVLWDLVEGKSLRRYTTFIAGLLAVAFHPDGRSALLGRLDSKLSLLDLESGECQNFLGHSGRLHTVALTPDGRRALSGSADGTLRLWDLCNGAEVRRLDYRRGRYRVAASLDLNRDETVGAIATFTGEILLWDVASGEPLRTLLGHTEMAIAGVKFLPDNRRLLSASGNIFAPIDDFSLRLWDVESGAEVRRFLGHTDKIWDMALSPDGSFAVTASHDGTVRRWELHTGDARILANVYPQAAFSCAISPDGRHLLLGLGKGQSDKPEFSLRLLDSATGQEVHRLSGHTEVVYDVEFSPDGRLALSGSQDRRLLLWDVTSGFLVASLSGFSDIPSRLAFSPDGALVCQGTTNGKVLLWDVAKRTLIRQLTGHQGFISALFFSASGNRLYSAGGDGTVREWRVDRDLPDLQAWIRCNRMAE
jgi:WD40 repeat protein/DNA-binding SARP family transcriptional activator/energy-coupling factor transporter ATP-binding protein EcfA2